MHINGHVQPPKSPGGGRRPDCPYPWAQAKPVCFFTVVSGAGGGGGVNRRYNSARPGVAVT